MTSTIRVFTVPRHQDQGFAKAHIERQGIKVRNKTGKAQLIHEMARTIEVPVFPGQEFTAPFDIGTGGSSMGCPIVQWKVLAINGDEVTIENLDNKMDRSSIPPRLIWHKRTVPIEAIVKRIANKVRSVDG